MRERERALARDRASYGLESEERTQKEGRLGGEAEGVEDQHLLREHRLDTAFSSRPGRSREQRTGRQSRGP